MTLSLERRSIRKRILQADWIPGICSKCAKRGGCTIICKPVELFINELGKPQPEIHIDDNRTMLLQHGKEIPFSAFRNEDSYLWQELERDKTAADEIEAEITLESLQSELIFYRLVKGESFASIAVRLNYDTPEAAASMYRNAQARFVEKIEAMNSRKKIVDHATGIIEKSKERTGEIPASHRWWLLFCILGILPKEIAALEGIDGKDAAKKVSTEIGKITRRLLDGELVFLNPHKAKNQKEIRSKQLDRIRQALEWGANQEF